MINKLLNNLPRSQALSISKPKYPALTILQEPIKESINVNITQLLSPKCNNTSLWKAAFEFLKKEICEYEEIRINKEKEKKSLK
jgi:hypothetical protein